MCDLFATPNSLKLQEVLKVAFSYSQYLCQNAEVVVSIDSRRR
jgi:hypothetical protein